jgi:hypothetical protein
MWAWCRLQTQQRENSKKQPPPEESVAAWCASKPVIVSQQLADAGVVALGIRRHDGNRGGHLTAHTTFTSIHAINSPSHRQCVLRISRHADLGSIKCMSAGFQNASSHHGSLEYGHVISQTVQRARAGFDFQVKLAFKKFKSHLCACEVPVEVLLRLQVPHLTLKHMLRPQ